MVELLLRDMYGAQEAVTAFERFATEVLESENYAIGASALSVYRHTPEPTVIWRSTPCIYARSCNDDCKASWFGRRSGERCDFDE